MPSAQPVDAVWVGGATVLRIDPSRVISAIHPLAGRRNATASAEPSDDRRLEFEAARPGPVAALEFHKPRNDVSAEVHGQLVVGNTSPRLNCRTIWSIHHGRPLSLDIDLPRSWVADRLEIEGVDEAISWHPEELPGRGVRIHATLPSGDWANRSLVVNLSATSSVAGGRGALAAFRAIRPAVTRVADEVWVARVETGFTIRPSRARGLSWIDPAVLPATGPRPRIPTALGPPWHGAGRQRMPRPSSIASIRSLQHKGRLSRSRPSLRSGSLSTLASSSIRATSPCGRSVLRYTEPVADAEGWRFFEPTTGQELQKTPIRENDRASAGLLGRGPSWRVDLPHPQRGRVVLVARYDGRWEGHGLIPLIVLPTTLRARGTVLVMAGREVRTTARTEGARALDPDVTAELLAADGMTSGDPSSSSHRHAHAYAYDSANVKLELSALALGSSGPGGVIREAVLTTVLEPGGGPGRRRLALRVAPDHASSLEVTLPSGARLDRVRRDGQGVAPFLTGDALSIPLGPAPPSRPLVLIAVDYTMPTDRSSQSMTLEPERPTLSMPCLSLAWEVILPEHWDVSEWESSSHPPSSRPAALATAHFLDGSFATRLHALEKNLFAQAGQRENQEATTNEMRVELAGRLVASRHEETSLGEWLTRLDAGRWPIVIDRIAIVAAGQVRVR